MKLEDLDIRPEHVVFELIQASGRAEQKIDTILENQKIMTERINKREIEIESLKSDLVEVDKRLVRVESSQSANRWWLGACFSVAIVVATLISKYV